MGLMGIGHPAGQEIDHPVDHAPMAGRFNLTAVFELIVERFNQRALAPYQFVG